MKDREQPSQEGLPKLVRDKVPARIKKDGFVPVVHIADETEYIKALRAKLLEEVGELIRTKTLPSFIEELADVEEVLDALKAQADVDSRQVEVIRQTKQYKNGKFSKRIILDRIDNPSQ